MNEDEMLNMFKYYADDISVLHYSYLSKPTLELSMAFDQLGEMAEEITNKFEKLSDKKEKETETMVDFGNMFNGMFKPVARGNCKMGMNGKVAVKTSTGYKTYDPKKNCLTNCDSFAFDMDGAFWVVPTFKVEKGDIILVNGKPRAVIEVGNNTIKTFSYEDSTIAETVPEHHVFMGKTYCYGKIFSPFMNMSKGDGMNSMMKMMMFSNMFGGNGATNGNMNPMMLMMMGGGSNPFEDMFDGAFDFGFEADADENEEE